MIMKKLLKIFIGLLLLVVLAVAALLITFDANNYKDQIIEQAELQTGREFKIDAVHIKQQCCQFTHSDLQVS